MKTQNPEVQQVKKQLLTIVLMIILIALDRYGVPLWFAFPALGMTFIGVLYIVLKRREAKQKGEVQS